MVILGLSTLRIIIVRNPVFFARNNLMKIIVDLTNVFMCVSVHQESIHIPSFRIFSKLNLFVGFSRNCIASFFCLLPRLLSIEESSECLHLTRPTTLAERSSHPQD